VLKEYGRLSGQKVKMAKSQIIYGEGVPSRVQRHIKRTLQMNEAHCPIKYLGVKYLGVNIRMKRLPRVAFELLLERLRAKLSSWKGRALSFAGKITHSSSATVDSSLFNVKWMGPKTILDKMMNATGDSCGAKNVMVMG